MPFDTELFIAGPPREPKQMLAEQEYGGHLSIHDDETAEKLGFAAGPIEGPTHFSQFAPLLVDVWGTDFLGRGCRTGRHGLRPEHGRPVSLQPGTAAGGDHRALSLVHAGAWRGVALSESRRTKSRWVRTRILDGETDDLVAEMLPNHATLKESYAGYRGGREE